MKEERFRTESASCLHAPTPVLSRAGRFHVPEAPTVARAVLLEHFEPNPNTRPRSGLGSGRTGSDRQRWCPGCRCGPGHFRGEPLCGQSPQPSLPTPGCRRGLGHAGAAGPHPARPVLLRPPRWPGYRAGGEHSWVGRAAQGEGAPEAAAALRHATATCQLSSSSQPLSARGLHRCELTGPKPQVR